MKTQKSYYRRTRHLVRSWLLEYQETAPSVARIPGDGPVAGGKSCFALGAANSIGCSCAYSRA